MGIYRSDNFFYANPKPSQEYERKFTNPGYVDWASTSEVNAAVDIQFRKNKYFWINSIYYECDNDGTTYRQIGGPSTGTGLHVAKVAITVTANVVNIPALIGKTLAYVISNGLIFQDFVNDGNEISLSGANLDMTAAGGVVAGGYLIVVYY